MADTTKNRIVYGISNVHVWPITATSDAGKPTYGSVIAVPGATAVSLDAEGSTDPFYADDTVYYQSSTNSGYSGSLTVADLPEEFLIQIMKETKDSTTGLLVEHSDVEPAEFAMAFEFKGDAKKRRHIFYRCKATRPSISSDTKEDTITPNTEELSISALPRLDNNQTKARCEEGDSAYSAFYTTVQEVADDTTSSGAKKNVSTAE